MNMTKCKQLGVFTIAVLVCLGVGGRTHAGKILIEDYGFIVDPCLLLDIPSCKPDDEKN